MTDRSFLDRRGSPSVFSAVDGSSPASSPGVASAGGRFSPAFSAQHAPPHLGRGGGRGGTAAARVSSLAAAAAAATTETDFQVSRVRRFCRLLGRSAAACCCCCGVGSRLLRRLLWVPSSFFMPLDGADEQQQHEEEEEVAYGGGHMRFRSGFSPFSSSYGAAAAARARAAAAEKIWQSYFFGQLANVAKAAVWWSMFGILVLALAGPAAAGTAVGFTRAAFNLALVLASPVAGAFVERRSIRGLLATTTATRLLIWSVAVPAAAWLALSSSSSSSSTSSFSALQHVSSQQQQQVWLQGHQPSWREPQPLLVLQQHQLQEPLRAHPAERMPGGENARQSNRRSIRDRQQQQQQYEAQQQQAEAQRQQADAQRQRHFEEQQQQRHRHSKAPVQERQSEAQQQHFEKRQQQPQSSQQLHLKKKKEKTLQQHTQEGRWSDGAANAASFGKSPAKYGQVASDAELERKNSSSDSRSSSNSHSNSSNSSSSSGSSTSSGNSTSSRKSSESSERVRSSENRGVVDSSACGERSISSSSSVCDGHSRSSRPKAAEGDEGSPSELWGAASQSVDDSSRVGKREELITLRARKAGTEKLRDVAAKAVRDVAAEEVREASTEELKGAATGWQLPSAMLKGGRVGDAPADERWAHGDWRGVSGDEIAAAQEEGLEATAELSTRAEGTVNAVATAHGDRLTGRTGFSNKHHLIISRRLAAAHLEISAYAKKAAPTAEEAAAEQRRGRAAPTAEDLFPYSSVAGDAAFSLEQPRTGTAARVAELLPTSSDLTTPPSVAVVRSVLPPTASLSAVVSQSKKGEKIGGKVSPPATGIRHAAGSADCSSSVAAASFAERRRAASSLFGSSAFGSTPAAGVAETALSNATPVVELFPANAPAAAGAAAPAAASTPEVVLAVPSASIQIASRDPPLVDAATATASTAASAGAASALKGELPAAAWRLPLSALDWEREQRSYLQIATAAMQTGATTAAAVARAISAKAAASATPVWEWLVIGATSIKEGITREHLLWVLVALMFVDGLQVAFANAVDIDCGGLETLGMQYDLPLSEEVRSALNTRHQFVFDFSFIFFTPPIACLVCLVSRFIRARHYEDFSSSSSLSSFSFNTTPPTPQLFPLQVQRVQHGQQQTPAAVPPFHTREEAAAAAERWATFSSSSSPFEGSWSNERRGGESEREVQGTQEVSEVLSLLLCMSVVFGGLSLLSLLFYCCGLPRKTAQEEHEEQRAAAAARAGGREQRVSYYEEEEEEEQQKLQRQQQRWDFFGTPVNTSHNAVGSAGSAALGADGRGMGGWDGSSSSDACEDDGNNSDLRSEFSSSSVQTVSLLQETLARLEDLREGLAIVLREKALGWRLIFLALETALEDSMVSVVIPQIALTHFNSSNGSSSSSYGSSKYSSSSSSNSGPASSTELSPAEGKGGSEKIPAATLLVPQDSFLPKGLLMNSIDYNARSPVSGGVDDWVEWLGGRVSAANLFAVCVIAVGKVGGCLAGLYMNRHWVPPASRSRASNYKMLFWSVFASSVAVVLLPLSRFLLLRELVPHWGAAALALLSAFSFFLFSTAPKIGFASLLQGLVSSQVVACKVFGFVGTFVTLVDACVIAAVNLLFSLFPQPDALNALVAVAGVYLLHGVLEALLGPLVILNSPAAGDLLLMQRQCSSSSALDGDASELAAATGVSGGSSVLRSMPGAAARRAGGAVDFVDAKCCSPWEGVSAAPPGAAAGYTHDWPSHTNAEASPTAASLEGDSPTAAATMLARKARKAHERLLPDETVLAVGGSRKSSSSRLPAAADAARADMR